MSKMSFHLAQALSAGRTRRAEPLTRESILAGLLQKRAAAARAGLADLERHLRSQIRWSLPVRSPLPAETCAGAADETPDTFPPPEQSRDV